MAATFATNGQRYRVHLSAALAKSLKQAQQRANQLGRGEEVIVAIKSIVRRLEHDPFDFGEPIYRLPALALEVRHGGIAPLFVDFAISEERSLVFIKGITFLP